MEFDDISKLYMTLGLVFRRLYQRKLKQILLISGFYYIYVRLLVIKTLLLPT